MRATYRPDSALPIAAQVRRTGDITAVLDLVSEYADVFVLAPQQP